MPLGPGDRIGPYEIVSPLGAGGMGEVYRARDSKLKREVALKVLPADVATDRERLARFQREAELLASLNHPNIAHVYGIEEGTPKGAPYEHHTALIMELVEGEDLAERLKRGPIPLDEALPIAKQIVEALECAHEAGIIHRDLKPANIKVRPDGTVKVLDFGLAKALEQGSGIRDQGSAHLANSPTITSPAMTLRGVILGTAAYMSPEQAKGKPVDKRADIWAFGAVLYEMLTGRRAFRGEDATDTIAEVLKSAVDFSALPPSTPAGVRRLLERCLQRDPKARLRDIGDARLELDAGARDETAALAPGTRRGLPYAAAAMLILAAVGVTAAGVWTIRRPNAPSPRPLIRVTWPLGDASELRTGIRRQQLALARNGRTLAVLGAAVMVRRTDQLSWTEIPNTRDVGSVFASPDGEWIGLLTRTGISKVRANGGPATTITQLRDTSNLGALSAFWGDDDRVYFADRTGIHVVPANGGTPESIASGIDYASVYALPGSRTLLVGRGRNLANPVILLRSLDGGEEVPLAEGLSPRFVAPDLLLFVRAGTIMGVRIDLAGRRLLGEPVALVDRVAMQAVVAQYDVADEGTLVYLSASDARPGQSTLQVRTGKGSLQPLHDTVRSYSDPRLSPDGRRLALHIFDQQDDIWVFDLARRAMTRLTFDPREDETPVWSPDGLWIAFAGQVRGGEDRAVLRRRADGGSGAEEVIWSSPDHSHVTDWSPDGRSLLVEVADTQRGSDVVLLDAEDRTVKRLLATPFNEAAARFSPDGKWIAYHSDESGRTEVYVQSFPGLERKVQVSTTGGEQPVWSRDGRTMYFRTETDFARVAMQTTGELRVTAPETLFPDTFMRPQAIHHTTYDVLPDGGIIVFDRPADARQRSAEVIGVFNWLDEVRQKVPIK